MVVESIQIK